MRCRDRPRRTAHRRRTSPRPLRRRSLSGSRRARRTSAPRADRSRRRRSSCRLRRSRRSLYVRDIVHEAVFLGALDYFKRFLARYLPCTAGAYVVLRALAHLHAHVLREMAAAVPQQRTRRAARTRRDRKRIVFIQIVRQALVVGNAGQPLDSALHGDNAHKAVAVGQYRPHRLHTQTRVFLKRAADSGCAAMSG